MAYTLNLQYPGYQQQVSYNSTGSAAAAAASAGNASASASAGATSTGGLFNGFNQLNNLAPQQQGLMQGFMQMMMQMLQMMMKMFGMNPRQQQQQTPYQQAQQPPMNAMQNPQAQFPFTPQAQNALPANNVNQAQNPQQNNLLSKVDPKELEAVKGQDLGAVDSKGYPKYLIDQGKDGKYHIYKQKKDGNGKRYKSVVKVKNGSNNLYVKDPEKNKAAASAAASSGGNGASAAASASASSMSFTYNPWTGNMTWSASSAAAAAASSGSSGNSGIVENQGGGKTGSPLILDTNGDGKVSAQQGMGVDVNGDGKADGAATGGDKMLAMGDLDGDGQISGKEVFGNETVDPFTGQKLNASNGFDALSKVAQSAQQHTGIQCIDANGQVDVQKLKQALEQSGKGSLGMISGNNTSTLEGLGNVSKIDTANYTNQQQTGDVQHNQIGSFTDLNGNAHRVDDVWFKLA